MQHMNFRCSIAGYIRLLLKLVLLFVTENIMSRNYSGFSVQAYILSCGERFLVIIFHRVSSL